MWCEQLLQEPAILTSFGIVYHNTTSFLVLILAGYFITAIGKEMKKISTGTIAVINLTMWVFPKHLELVRRRNVEEFEVLG